MKKEIIFKSFTLSFILLTTSSITHADPFIFEAPLGTEVARFTEQGYLGIGTPSPEARLDIFNGNVLLRVKRVGFNTASSPSLILRSSLGLGEGSAGPYGDRNLKLQNIVKRNDSGESTYRFGMINNINKEIFSVSSDGALSVAGIIESKNGGVKFPDGSVQTTAATTTAPTPAPIVTTVISAAVTLNTNTQHRFFVNCPDGYKVIGGGFDQVKQPAGGRSINVYAIASFPFKDDPRNDATKWVVAVASKERVHLIKVHGYATCIKTQGIQPIAINLKELKAGTKGVSDR